MGDPNETHDFICDRCEFVSHGWGTEVERDARGEQHHAEHDTDEPMQELADFRKD